MGEYVTYTDYAALYPSKLSEDAFNAYLPAAEAYIDMITRDRACSASGYKAERVKMAVCAVIGEMAAQDAAKNAQGARLASVSNDGYTESYGAAAGVQSESESIWSAAVRWLSGTGLVGLL